MIGAAHAGIIAAKRGDTVVATELTPAEMAFSVVHTIDMEANGAAALFPAGLQWLDEPFDADTGQFTHLTEGTQATFTVTAGQAILDNNTAGARNSIIQSGPDIGMPQVWVEIELAAHPDTSTIYDNIGVGVCKDANNFIFASFDRLGPRLRVQVKSGGTNTFLVSLSSSDFNFSYPWKLACAIVGNSVTVFYDKVDGSGWRYYDGVDITAQLDFKAADLTGWKPAFTAATPNSSEWVFDNFKAGRFGAVGLRDVDIVTNEDGSPYDIENDHVYLTATCSDPYGVGYMGVFELDMTDYSLAQTGVIMVDRDGKVQTDHAGHIVVRSNGDQSLFISTWGNGFGGVLDVLMKSITPSTAQDMLSGGTVLDTMTTLSLPGDLGGSYGVYDPYPVKVGSEWLMAYAVTTDTDFTPENFYIAAATSSDLSSWSSVDEDTSRTIYEGPKICIANGQRWILGGGRTDAIIYDESMNYVGTLNYVLDAPSGDTQPHTNIFPYGSKFILLTNTDDRYGIRNFTWGHLVIQESARYP